MNAEQIFPGDILTPAEEEILTHIESTRLDKYAVNGTEVMTLVYELKLDQYAPLYASFKYICRFCAVIGKKTANRIDLIKAAHYIEMEIKQRQAKEVQTHGTVGLGPEGKSPVIPHEYPAEVFSSNGLPIWVDKGLTGDLDKAVRFMAEYANKPTTYHYAVGLLYGAFKAIADELAKHPVVDSNSKKEK